jgi:hypothetical protein
MFYSNFKLLFSEKIWELSPKYKLEKTELGKSMQSNELEIKPVSGPN